jgi:hypothetical protein
MQQKGTNSLENERVELRSQGGNNEKSNYWKEGRRGKMNVRKAPKNAPIPKANAGRNQVSEASRPKDKDEKSGKAIANPENKVR